MHRGGRSRIRRSSSPWWQRIVLFLLLAGGIGGGVVYYRWQTRTASPPLLMKHEEEKSGGAERGVTLFFASPSGERLQGEERGIPQGGLLEEIRATLQALIEGSQQGNLRLLPSRTEVRAVYLDTQGTAYVDFTAALRTDHPGGSWWELLTIYSIVDSLIHNFPEIKQVQILVEGEAIETLTGHVRIDTPLTERLLF